MNETYIHLILNHIPILTTLLGIPILLFGIWRKQAAVIQVGLGLFILGALTTLPVYFSGEGAEETVEHLPGVAESLIESHEEWAKFALGFMITLGAAALGTLFGLARKPEWTRGLLAGVSILALVAGGTIVQTAHLGGQIRHSEIRSASSEFRFDSNASSKNNSQKLEDTDHDDD